MTEAHGGNVSAVLTEMRSALTALLFNVSCKKRLKGFNRKHCYKKIPEIKKYLETEKNG